jgi:hypothetical protein
VWSECKWVMNTIFNSFAFRAAIPSRSAAAARRTTPGPQSIRYARPFTTTATAGPHRSGSALGLPVPNTTTRVGAAACSSANAPAQEATATTNTNTRKSFFTRNLRVPGSSLPAKRVLPNCSFSVRSLCKFRPLWAESSNAISSPRRKPRHSCARHSSPRPMLDPDSSCPIREPKFHRCTILMVLTRPLCARTFAPLEASISLRAETASGQSQIPGSRKLPSPAEG